MAVYVFQGAQVSPVQHKLLGLFGAITAGAFSFFLSGNIGLTLTSSPRGWFGITLKATGGLAVLVFFLYWWGSYAPITIQVQAVRIEIKNLVAELEAQYNNLKLSLTNFTDLQHNAQFVRDRAKALKAANRALRDKFERIMLDPSLNPPEQDFVRAALKRTDEEATSQQPGITDTSPPGERQSPGDPMPTNADFTPPSPPNPSLVFFPRDLRYSIEGIPSAVVVVYDELSDTLKKNLSKHFAENIGKFGEYYFVKNPNPGKQAQAHMAYVGTDSEDMVECAKFVQFQLDQAEPGLGSSLQKINLSADQRPPMPAYEEGQTALWAPDPPNPNVNGTPEPAGHSKFSFHLVETGVPIASAYSRTNVLILGGPKTGTTPDGKRSVWVYIP